MRAERDGISVFKVDQPNGNVELVDAVRDLVDPSFLTLDRSGNFLCTVHGDQNDISAFKVDKTSGKLQFINRQSTGGNNPVHPAIDPRGHYIVAFNHLSSSLALMPIARDDSLGGVSQLVTLTGPLGPHRGEQKPSKPHFNQFDPTGRFIIVQDKGLDWSFSLKLPMAS
jgi:6-phosphogluconolactonase